MSNWVPNSMDLKVILGNSNTPPLSSPTEELKHELERPEFGRAIEKRILRKLDTQVVPVLFFLFLVSFVDRGNIGNAHIQGMDSSLKLEGNNYNIAVMVFSLAYVVFGIPANLVFKATRPRSLSIMMFLWGFCALGQGLVTNFAGLVALRFLMGILEAGFVPGCAYLIGTYYKKDEFLRRYTVFFSAGIAAGAFNGLLASLFTKMDGLAGHEGWRWIFIMEGIITIATGLVAYFVMIDFPEHETKRFTSEEKVVLLARLARDGGQTPHDSWKIYVLDALTDWKVWLATIVYISAEENASSVGAFQPTVLKGIGYTSTGAQVHSIPVFVVALVLSLGSSYLSEKLGQRYLFILFGFTLTVIGTAVELAQPKAPGARYMGMFFLTSGGFIVMPITVVWLAINVGKGYKRAVALGSVIAVGNCGAFISSNVFITSESPTFRTGFSVGLGMTVIGVTAATLMYIGLRVENARRDGKQAGLDANQERNDILLEGDKHPAFKFQL